MAGPVKVSIDARTKIVAQQSREPRQGRKRNVCARNCARIRASFLLWVIISTVFFAITAWFAGSTFSTRPSHQVNRILQYYFKISFGKTVAVLRVLQGLTSTFTGIAVGSAFETIQWELVNGSHGLRLLSLLSLSPATGAFGVFKLIFSGKQHISLYALSRTTFTALLFVAGLVLFINTSVITVYHPTSTFNIVAGTGQFNGSYVAPFLQTIGNTIPFWALASTYSFVTNSLFSVLSTPIECPYHDRQCDSHLLPGGTYLMYPQLSPSPSSDSVVSIYNASATQLDFIQGIESSDQFSDQDCTVYGNDNSYVGVKFCLAHSQVQTGALIAEISACTNGTSAGECLTKTPGFSPNISTTLTVYNRQASTICSASNNSILSVFDLGSPVLDPSINITALNLAVAWLLNYTSADIPPESSINFLFWFDPSSSYQSLWETNAYNTLQSLLGFLIWEFSENNNGNPAVSDPEAKNQLPDLPQQFHTQASVCETYLRFVISSKMFITYLVLEGVAVVFCWATLAWHFCKGGKGELPGISSYPAVDFASKLDMQEVDKGKVNLEGKFSMEDGDKAVRNKLADVVVRLRRATAL